MIVRLYTLVFTFALITTCDAGILNVAVVDVISFPDNNCAVISCPLPSVIVHPLNVYPTHVVALIVTTSSYWWCPDVVPFLPSLAHTCVTVTHVVAFTEPV
jgi:hypothetical protein